MQTLFLHTLVYDFWRRTLPRYLPLENGIRGLECGIGPGKLLSLLEKWFPKLHLYGLDIDFRTLNEARQLMKNSYLLQASAEFLPFSWGKFDFIIAFHLLEHLEDPEQFLREAFQVLNPDGLFILSTPNPEGLGARLRGPRWNSFCPEHISLHPPRVWRKMLARYGFVILREGTTGLSGFPVFRKLPIALLNWGPLFLFGFFPWRHGEAYICISRKQR